LFCTEKQLKEQMVMPRYLPTQMAVELSSGSKGHLAMPLPMPGSVSCDVVRLDCNESDRVNGRSARPRGTYVHDPVLRIVCVGAAQVQTAVVGAHRLNHANMIATVKVL